MGDEREETLGWADELRGLSLVDQRRFLARVQRWLPTISGAMAALYGDEAEWLSDQLLRLAARAAVTRKLPLRILDAERETNPDWFQSPDRVGYVAYTEQFGPTINDVAERTTYLEEFGVTYLHLMNVLAARPAPNDGGFAVQDYRDVTASLGTIYDLEQLADRLRESGISLCIDFVMNHTAYEHEWAQMARSGSEAHRNFYLVFPDRELPNQYEETLPEVFPEMAPGNFTWDEQLNGWVWTTFNSYQWDLNYRNPQVLAEMFDIMLFLANMGVDVLRLDAVAFTWKRMGTNCQNQPEAHRIVQILRAMMAIATPAVLLKAEAIVGPRELTAYLGAHSRERAECQIAYHNQLMVMLWSALATRDAVLITESMSRLPATPRSAGWVSYIRCHDDIGWAVDDEDAAGVGISGIAHRRFLAEWYRGDFPGTFAHGASFSVNEETGDERTCGMTASLCGITDAVEQGDEVALDLGIRRMMLAYGVVASFGIPLVYMGDEVAMGNDFSYLTDSTKADDSRWMQRPAMDWERVERRHLENSVEQRVFNGLRELIDHRRSVLPLYQGGEVEILRVENHRVFAFVRRHPQHGVLLGLANFSEEYAHVSTNVFHRSGVAVNAPEILNSGVEVRGEGIVLPPLKLAWFTTDSVRRILP